MSRMIDFERMRKLIRDAPRIADSIEVARSRAYGGSPAMTGMPGGSSKGDKLERDAISLMAVERAYSETLEELKKMRDELKPLIDSLDDAGERAVMRLRYLEGFSPEVISSCELVPMARRTVYRCLRKGEVRINAMQK